jgi:hypothetical protein
MSRHSVQRPVVAISRLSPISARQSSLHVGAGGCIGDILLLRTCCVCLLVQFAADSDGSARIPSGFCGCVKPDAGSFGSRHATFQRHTIPRAIPVKDKTHIETWRQATQHPSKAGCDTHNTAQYDSARTRPLLEMIRSIACRSAGN